MCGRRSVVGWIVCLLILGAGMVSAQSTRTWTGQGGNALASTAGNWNGGVAPIAGDHIVLDASHTGYAQSNLTWDLAIAVASWTQQTDYTNAVTFLTKFPAGGAFTNFLINGDATVDGGVWTHNPNGGGATEHDRLAMTVGGVFTLGENAAIDVSARGYAAGQGPGKGTGRGGGGHGGQGGRDYTAIGRGPVYGLITAPNHLGSGGGSGSARGGGAVWLDVAGTATLAGAVRANGQHAPSLGGGGAGGSIRITAGAVAGGGALSADGGNGNNGAGGGGGGRIAVVLTHATDWATLTFSALGGWRGHFQGTEDQGGAGTVWLKPQNETHGRLQVDAAARPTGALTVFNQGTNQFDAMVLTNGAMFGAMGTAVLDLSNDPVIRTHGGSGNLPARLMLGIGGSAVPAANTLWPAGVMDGYTLSMAGESPLDYSGDLLLTNGAVLTHERNGATTDPMHRLILSVAGDLTIAADAAIDVRERGYGPAQGPGSGSGRGGGGHGGQGGRDYTGSGRGAAYGDVMTPTNSGSGGSAVAWGGGAVQLTATGTMILNGTIRADGQHSPSLGGGGAGGAIWLSATALTGTGQVLADGGNGNNGAGGGAGGRIAVVLNAGTPTDAVRFSLNGGQRGVYGAEEPGAAGTYYLKTPAFDQGILSVSNALASSSVTPLEAGVSGRSYRDVIIAGQGRLQLGQHETLAVYGSWSNRAAFSALHGSRVEFLGPAPATLFGSSPFYELACAEPGKALAFEAGQTTSVTGLLHLAGAAGAGNQLTLRSTADGSPWYLVFTSGRPQSVARVDVRDSNAAGGEVIVAPFSTDAGNNTHWRFGEGFTVTWTGAATANWGDAANWDAGIVPTFLDPVVIPDTARDPVLDVNREVAGLLVGTAATLSMNGRDLIAHGPLNNYGSIRMAGSETLLVLGDACFAPGSLVANRGTIQVARPGGPQSLSAAGVTFHRLELLGEGKRYLDCDGAVFDQLIVSNLNGTVFFESGFSAHRFECEIPDADLEFAHDAQFTINRLLMHGTAAQPIRLRGPAAPGNGWRIAVPYWHAMRHVRVSDSDASAGPTLHAIDALDDGGNSNWDFGPWHVWTGAVSTDFADPANWAGGLAPGPDAKIWLDGYAGFAPHATGPVVLRRLTLGLTAPAVFTVDGGLTVTEDLFVLRTGSMTHSANAATDIYRLHLDVEGDLRIDMGGAIDVSARGFAGGQGPGKGAGRGGGGYGGQGGRDYTGIGRGTVYGVVTAPNHLGSGGASVASGGGLVAATVAGTLMVDGHLGADGQHSPSLGGGGAGGTVRLRVGRLTGTGTITAAGGNGNNGAGGGGGGRIALAVTNASEFGSVSFSIAGGNRGPYSNDDHGAAGTCHLEWAAGGAGGGGVTIDNDGKNTGARTLLPPPSLAVPREMKYTPMLVTNLAAVALTGPLMAGDLTMATNTATRLYLNGHTLKLWAVYRSDWSHPDWVQYDGGRIEWARPSLLVIK